jgi:hypothetical protein
LKVSSAFINVSIQFVGAPINHPTNFGANAPRFSVGSDAPFCASPLRSSSLDLAPDRLLRPPSTSATAGVGQGVSCAALFNPGIGPRFVSGVLGPPSASDLTGVGHGDPVQPLSDVWSIDRESWDRNRPAGVCVSFQIKENSVEPTKASLARNLLSHDDKGPRCVNESMKVGPQMPWIGGAKAFARDRERLAGAASGPQGLVVGPSCHSGSDTPQSPAGKEVDLLKSCDIQGPHIFNRALVNDPRRDYAISD